MAKRTTKDKIALPFHCADKSLAFTKGEGDSKRRYLRGISSGIDIDAHGERMTPNAIKSFGEQAKNGEILLYADKHDIAMSDDIGRLVEFEISEKNEWVTTYELYDGSEGAQPYQVQRATAVFNQVAGLAPYKKPLQKGFSIEGYIPDGGVIDLDMEGGARRAIDEVQLEGVVVVSRPAYQDSVASGIFKALGERAPWQSAVKDVESRLRERVNIEQVREKLWSNRWKINSALDEEIESIMTDQEVQDKRLNLEQAFDDYKRLMVDLILNSADAFQSEDDDEPQGVALARSVYGNGKHSDLRVAKDKLAGMFQTFVKQLKGE